MSTDRLRVVFIGGFRLPSEGGVPGGQVYACRQLTDGPLAKRVHFLLLDSTQISQPPPPVIIRLLLAMRRLLTFVWLLLSTRPKHVLIFVGNGLGFCEKGLMVLIARFCGVPVVLCPRSGLLLDDLAAGPGFRWFVGLVLRRCRYIVCQGRFWRRVLADAMHVQEDDARLRVIGNAINPTTYESIGTPPHASGQVPVRVLYMGWIETYKGALDLVEAVRLGGDAMRKIVFTICGGGGAEGTMRAAISAAGLEDHFDFRGWVQDMAKTQVLAETDMLVLPSHREGFPNILLEALAAARPIVATRVGAVSDLFLHGDIGELVPPNDPARLAAAILTMAQDPLRLRNAGAFGRTMVHLHHNSGQQWRLWLPLFTSDRVSRCAV